VRGDTAKYKVKKIIFLAVGKRAIEGGCPYDMILTLILTLKY